MTDTYFKSLLYRHGELQNEIDRELRAPNPNWMRVLKLKKLRLALKDRLHRLARSAAKSQRNRDHQRSSSLLPQTQGHS